MATPEEALRDHNNGLPDGLRRHVERMVEEALRLAAAHGLDEERVRLAALGHDIVRAEPPQELLRLAGELGLEPSDVERAEPVLLHGVIAARLLPERFGVADPEILDAIRYHTTGRVGMSALEKVVYIADKTEPGGLKWFPEWGEVRDLADRDLDAALLKGIDLSIERALRKGWSLHPDTVAARNHLLQQRGAR
jgi:predicted HD superfamily hydrolase involved in NAD metabolism